MRREKMTRLLLESLSGDPAVVKTPETVTREGRKSTKQGLPPSSRERSKSESCRKSWKRPGRTGEEERQVWLHLRNSSSVELPLGSPIYLWTTDNLWQNINVNGSHVSVNFLLLVLRFFAHVLLNSAFVYTLLGRDLGARSLFLGHCFYCADTGTCLRDRAGCWHRVLPLYYLGCWAGCLFHLFFILSLLLPDGALRRSAVGPVLPHVLRLLLALAAALRRQGGGVFLRPRLHLPHLPRTMPRGRLFTVHLCRGYSFVFPNLCLLLLLHYIQSLKWTLHRNKNGWGGNKNRWINQNDGKQN